MITICTPTLNRYDLLPGLLISVEKSSIEAAVHIIDNGGRLDPDLHLKGCDLTNVTITVPGENLGVACSWNWFLMSGRMPMIIVNDDLLFDRHDIKSFLTAYENEDALFYYCDNLSPLNMFSCFMPTAELVRTVGLFDEHFYPAYFEDNDYAYRMRLLNVKTFKVKTDITHFGSSTLAAFSPDQRTAHHQSFNKLREYYLMKWGGMPHMEMYERPFNVPVKT